MGLTNLLTRKKVYKSPFLISTDFSNTLKKMNHVIADDWLKMSKDKTLSEISFIDVFREDRVLCINSNKTYKYFEDNVDINQVYNDETKWVTNRDQIKIGKFISKIFIDKYPNNAVSKYASSKP